MNRRPFHKIDAEMTFAEITASASKIYDEILFSWEFSLENMTDAELSPKDLLAKEETLTFLEKLNDFITDEYFEAKSEFLEEILW